MPIDSSIYRQNGGFATGLQQGIAIGDLFKKGRRENQEQQERDAIKNAYKSGVVKNPDGSVSMDKSKTLASLFEASPQEAMAYQEKSQAQDAATRKLKMDTAMNEINLASQLLGGVKDQASWDQALQAAGKFGMDISQMPKVYDQSFVSNLNGRVLTAKDRFDQEMKVKNFGLETEKLNASKQEAAAKAKKDAGNLAAELRKERSSLPTTKATQEISAAYNKIQSAAQNPSAAGDISLLIGYMKLLDPSSTVREGEFATAQNAAGIDSRVVNAYNNILSGQRLSPQQRQDFMGHAGGLYKSQMAIQSQVDSQFSNMANKSGIDPKDVILNFEAQRPDTLGSGEQPQVFKTNQIKWKK